MEWSIDTQDGSSYEIGALVLGLLQNRYMARIGGYNVTFDNEVSVDVTLPDDPWTRRVVLHWAQIDRNQIFIERARRVHAFADQWCSESRALLQRLRETASPRRDAGAGDAPSADVFG